MTSASPIKVQPGAAKWVDWLRDEADRLEIEAYVGSLGEVLIDAGAKRRGRHRGGTRHRQIMSRRPRRGHSYVRRDNPSLALDNRRPLLAAGYCVSLQPIRGLESCARQGSRRVSSRWVRGPLARWREKSLCSRSLAIATKRREQRL